MGVGPCEYLCLKYIFVLANIKRREGRKNGSVSRRGALGFVKELTC